MFPWAVQPASAMSFTLCNCSAEAIEKTGADIRHAGNRVHYDSQDDTITLPHRHRFVVIRWARGARMIRTEALTPFTTGTCVRFPIADELGSRYVSGTALAAGSTRHRRLAACHSQPTVFALKLHGPVFLGNAFGGIMLLCDQGQGVASPARRTTRGSRHR